jgi:hypothetical protein
MTYIYLGRPHNGRGRLKQPFGADRRELIFYLFMLLYRKETSRHYNPVASSFARILLMIRVGYVSVCALRPDAVFGLPSFPGTLTVNRTPGVPFGWF